MINELKASWSQFNQAVCALRFFYSFTCKRDWVVQQVPYGPRPKTLPVVLSGDEVARMIACVHNIKHKTVLLTLYSLAEISEGLNLRLPDIDSQRMMLKVNQGKGSKDRYVPISPRLLVALRDYWRQTRPSDYLFPGKTDDIPLNKAVVQKVCTLAAAQAKIHKHVTPHTMRHSLRDRTPGSRSRLDGHQPTAGAQQLYNDHDLSTLPQTTSRQFAQPIDWLPVRQCPKWIDPTLRNSDQDQSQDNNPGRNSPNGLRHPSAACR